MRFNISDEEILETWRMVEVEKLISEPITMGINILDCGGRCWENRAGNL